MYTRQARNSNGIASDPVFSLLLRELPSLQAHLRYAIFPFRMDQKTISNLATPAGRVAYQSYWRDLILEQRSAVLPSLWQLWHMAAFGTEMRITASDTVYRIGHPLGMRIGFRVFMEEVISRYYFNNVQALVYLGAVILLAFLGLRFAGVLSEAVSLIGIGIEACMLLILFAVLFYAPEEQIEDPAQTTDVGKQGNDEGEDRALIREVLEELEEIGGSYAGLALKLEQSARAQEESIRELTRRVAAIQGLNLLESHAERLETTNTLLAQLTSSIDAMNQRVDRLFSKDIEYYVRQEFERMVGRNDNGTPPAGIEERGRR